MAYLIKLKGGKVFSRAELARLIYKGTRKRVSEEGIDALGDVLEDTALKILESADKINEMTHHNKTIKKEEVYTAYELITKTSITKKQR